MSKPIVTIAAPPVPRQLTAQEHQVIGVAIALGQIPAAQRSHWEDAIRRDPASVKAQLSDRTKRPEGRFFNPLPALAPRAAAGSETKSAADEMAAAFNESRARRIGHVRPERATPTDPDEVAFAEHRARRLGGQGERKPTWLRDEAPSDATDVTPAAFNDSRARRFGDGSARKPTWLRD